MEISVLHNNFLTYVVEPFSYPKNYKKTKQSHFATTSRPVEGFSHEDSIFSENEHGSEPAAIEEVSHFRNKKRH